MASLLAFLYPATIGEGPTYFRVQDDPGASKKALGRF